MNYKSKNRLIIAVLCIIVAVILFFIVKGIFKDTDNKKDDSDKTSNSQTVDNENDTSVPKEPDIGESDSEVNSNTDEKDDGNQSSGSKDESDNKNDSTTSTEAPDKSQTPATKPENGSSSSTWESSLGTTEVAVPADAPKTYKDFSLTKGMSASEAYDYLNTFLSSKYSILINKQNKVASDYVPSDLITPSGCSYPMEKVAGNALVELLSDARKNGINDLVLYSGYRTVASQKSKYETRTQKYLDQGYSQADAEAKAGEYIAPPGASEHHTGLAADVCSSAIVNKYGYLSDDFDTTASYKWMRENCTKYGFIVRYSKDDEAITGYLYEPWHIRYIGVDHAKACTELGYTYEEYHAMLLKLRDSAKAAA